jgi:hypothetical protein
LSFKPVLVHSCRPTSDVGKPLACRCQRHVTFKRAAQLVSNGHALRRLLPSGRVNDREIVLVRREPPRPARTISANDIRSAYVLQNDKARQRIEIYGGQP